MRTARALNPNAAVAAEDFPIQVRDLQAWTSGDGRHAGITAHPSGEPCAGDLDPRQLRLRRAARRAFRPAVCLRVFLHRRPGRRAGDCAVPAPVPAERAPSRAAGDAVHLGARRGDRRRGAPSIAVARPLANRSRPRRPRAVAVARRDRRARLRRGRGAGPGVDARARLRRLGQDGERAHRPPRRGVRRSTRSSINTWAHDPAVRRTSYALLAEAFSLSARRPYVKRRQIHSSGP